MDWLQNELPGNGIGIDETKSIALLIFGAGRLTAFGFYYTLNFYMDKIIHSKFLKFLFLIFRQTAVSNIFINTEKANQAVNLKCF